MNTKCLFFLFYMATFLQSGAYGLTFLLPKRFVSFGADEKAVGNMLFVTAITTLLTVYFSGHISDKLGRVRTLAVACFAIAMALVCYAFADSVGGVLALASVLLGWGWGLTYSLSPIVLTQLITEEARVRTFAMFAIAMMAGFGLSPVLVAMMEKSGFSIADAFYVTAFLCALAGGIFLMLIHPVRHLSQITQAQPRSQLSLQSVLVIMRSRASLPVVMGCLGGSVFAGMNNFQTVFAEARQLQYADYFLAYTVTVIAFRVALVRFNGGKNPYLTIAGLQSAMFASVVLFLFIGGNGILYILVAVLFGIGYGVSYPILVAMVANDAEPEQLPQTMQFFALSYFIGIFGFPLIAGWLIVEVGMTPLLILVSILAGLEAVMAFLRSQQKI